jgi:hypothetical protein
MIGSRPLGSRLLAVDAVVIAGGVSYFAWAPYLHEIMQVGSFALGITIGVPRAISAWEEVRERRRRQRQDAAPAERPGGEP